MDPQPPAAGISAPGAADRHGVCGRTPQVRDALVAATNSESCAAVTASRLAEINVLNLTPDAETGTPIGELRRGDFDGLGALQHLLLSENQLRALPPQVFVGAPNLVSLDLSYNGLAGLPAGVFSGLGRLESLSLLSNRLTNLSAAVFEDVPGLRSLDLTANGIAGLPGGLFRGIRDLESLSATFNNLQAWPGEALRDLQRLQELHLLGNGLSVLPRGAFDGHPHLHTVGLAQNRLRAVPAGVFRDLRALRHVDLADNLLAELPEGLFVGAGSLEFLHLRNNPGGPFDLLVELERTDADDPTAPGPAQVRARVRLGAPFPMTVSLAVSGGRLSASSVRIGGGEAASDEVAATNAAGSSLSVAPVAPLVPQTFCSGLPCYNGLRVVAGTPLVLANPATAITSIPAVHLTQATQTLQGGVPLVAGRQALLRVFVRSDSANAFRPAGRAVFHREGAVVHTAALEAPRAGIPQALREGDLGASFNAVVPGQALQPGVEMVVEIDPERTLPLAPGSVRRVPSEGRTALDVREVAPLELAIVPVLYLWGANAQNNGRVADLARRIAGGDPAHLRYLKALLPVARVDATARDAYYTWNDTTEMGAIGVLEELQMLRHLEAGGTERYYHGIFAPPKFVHQAGFWEFLGVAFQPGRAGLTRSHTADGEPDPEFAHTLAHEIGHNVNLGHAPCGNPFGVDPDFPYQRASTGVWGYEFSGPAWPARLFDPAQAVDLMSYCRPYWISDYSFRKALDYRIATAGDRPGRRTETLLLWGGVHDGRLRLEPAFAWRAPVKVPRAPGPYRLAGHDAGGAELFSFSFSPDDVDHGGGRSFLFAIPFRPAWRTTLQTVVVSGPEGFATHDMETSSEVAVFTDAATGRIRSVARQWPGVVPPRLRAQGPLSVVPGWRR